jgi:hypothetical protein
MPSQIANEIDDRYYYRDSNNVTVLTECIDEALQEVREVLEGIRGFYGTADCWCDSEDGAPHFKHCDRARELYQRLRADGGKENDGT